MALIRLHQVVSISTDGKPKVLYIGTDPAKAQAEWAAAQTGEKVAEVQLFKYLTPTRRKSVSTAPVHSSTEDKIRDLLEMAASPDDWDAIVAELVKFDPAALVNVARELGVERSEGISGEEFARRLVLASVPKPASEEKPPTGVQAELLKLDDATLAKEGERYKVQRAEGQSREDFAKAIAIAAGYKFD